jgi:hypothetical protein
MGRAKVEPVIVTNKSDAPEILASAIEDVAKSAKQLLNSRLSRKAISILISHTAKQPQWIVELILNEAANLDKFVQR